MTEQVYRAAVHRQHLRADSQRQLVVVPYAQRCRSRHSRPPARIHCLDRPKSPAVSRSPRCASTPSGHTIAEPAIPLVRSRRRIASPKGSGLRRLAMQLQQSFATGGMGFRPSREIARIGCSHTCHCGESTMRSIGVDSAGQFTRLIELVGRREFPRPDNRGPSFPNNARWSSQAGAQVSLNRGA